MKRVLPLALSATMAFSLVACGSSSSTTTGEAETTAAPAETETTETTVSESTGEKTSADTLVVGTTDMNGDFINGFGNSSYDKYIKDMLHSFYDTVYVDGAGEIKVAEVNVVESYETTDNADGSKTYTWHIYDDLKWNNGEAITAADYVASFLVSISPEWVEAGASTSGWEAIVGSEDYYRGYAVDENGLAVDADGNTIGTVETDEDGNEVINANLSDIQDQLVKVTDLAGVQLIDDTTFSITLSADYLPYYYEIYYAAAGPIYTKGWVPGATVVSDENGSHFEFTEGDLQTALNNVASTERFAPTVTCGPYKFVSFENQIVTLQRNEYFKCDYEGNTPQLEYVVQKAVNQTTDVDQVIAGELDLVTGVIEGKKIEAAKSSDTTELHSYLRNGYGLIAFTTDFGPTKDANVRWALASMIDRSQVIDYVLGGYGGTVDSEYGLAQWTYQAKAEELADTLKPITFNMDVANDYLDETEWVYEADGTTPWDREKAAADGSYMRYNSDGEMLVIEHFGTDNNSVTDVIEMQYLANAPLAGLKFNITKGDFQVLLDNYYYGSSMSESERKYNSFNLASNFGTPDDKYYSSWHSDFAGTWQNASNVADAELDSLIEQMRSLDPSETEKYADIWAEYQVRWQEILPNIPLYSNEYFDIFGSNVSGVETTPFYSYSQVICQITKSN